MKNAIVIIRGEKDSSFDEKVHKLGGESDINIVGIFHDYRIGDSDGHLRDMKIGWHSLKELNEMQKQLLCKVISLVGLDRTIG